ncbi:MAG TPA: head-tail adaptor protein [Planctomycetaceae bacterium]|nr:head-tail adaptor protein [Planctomycetaceae bacterium]
MIRAGTLRHVVNVMKPAENSNTRGQPTGEDEVYIKDVPCSIEPLGGRESEIARQVFESATAKVKFYGDPNRPISRSHYLQFGSRRLEIGDVKDVEQNGIVIELLVGEVVDV